MHWAIQQLWNSADKTACIESDKSWTYQEIVERINELGCKLQSASIPAYSPISIETGLSIECLIGLLACQQQKLVAIPLSHELGESERQKARKITSAKWQIGNNSQVREVQSNGSPSPLIDQLKQRQHAGLILFSSGTSGEPKAMLHDFDTLLERYRGVKPRLDRSLLLMHLDHIGGIDAALRTLLAGSTLIIPETRSPEQVARTIQQHQVNILPATPTFLNLLLLSQQSKAHNLSSLEIIAYGAEAMPPALLKRLADQFPKADLQQKFGTSETGAIRIQSTQTNSLFFRIQDRDTEWRVHSGELWLKTPSRILGYLNADASSLESDNWYRTGDLVEETKQGTLRIIGRKSELINVGGEKVTPGEVEAIVLEVPGVEACTVYGESNPITGQSVGVTVVPEKHSEPQELKRRIKQHCRTKLSGYKIPVRIVFSNLTSYNKRFKKIRQQTD